MQFSRPPGTHIEVFRLLELVEKGAFLDDTDATHIGQCEHCRTLLLAFTSDRAKQRYRKSQNDISEPANGTEYSL
jgi:hypothetical protein